MSNTFDIHELEDFTKELLTLANETMPKESRKFLNKEGMALKKETKSVAQQKVKKKTGNYLKGIRKGKVYKWQGKTLAVRVFAKNDRNAIDKKTGKRIAPHAHLIEYGHRQVVNGKEVGFVKGRYVYESAYKQFQNQYFSDCDKFIDELLEKGLT